MLESLVLVAISMHKESYMHSLIFYKIILLTLLTLLIIGTLLKFIGFILNWIVLWKKIMAIIIKDIFTLLSIALFYEMILMDSSTTVNQDKL